MVKEIGRIENKVSSIRVFEKEPLKMFKLYIFIIVIAFHSVKSKPIDTQSLLNAEDFDTENYDVIIDQRQNGTQNFRIKITGLNIAIPDDREQPQQSDPSTATLEQFASFLIPPQSSGSQQQISSNLDDFADLAAFFDWKKKANKKSNDFTQSRTKDIPTDAQLADDTKTKVKDLVREEQRKYKLLVGEKYIIPILRFLKKQTDDVKE